VPVYYPRLLATGSSYCLDAAANCPLEIASPGSYPRAYRIRDRTGHGHSSYRMTVELNPILGEYYGVQGTTWQNPPILNSPTETRRVTGRRLEIYANAGKVSLVAWHTPRGVYWISNTLTDTLSGAQMVAIAASFQRH
jgi:hypothetical protein